jgi:hypothetical protein
VRRVLGIAGPGGEAPVGFPPAAQLQTAGRQMAVEPVREILVQPAPSTPAVPVRTIDTTPWAPRTPADAEIVAETGAQRVPGGALKAIGAMALLWALTRRGRR